MAQQRKFRNRSLCILGPDIIESQAIQGLSGKAMLTLIRFHQKAHRKKQKGKRYKGMESYTITNNGQIIFTYTEARELGMSDKTFYRAVRELVERGFIDVAERGHYQGESNKFGISQRWKRFGTDEFERVEIPRALPRGMGFQPGNFKGKPF